MGLDLGAAPSSCGCNFGNTEVLTGQCTLGNAAGAMLLMKVIEETILKHCVKTDKCPSVKSVEDAYPSGFLNDDYDFVVVGGGVAGSVLASRLSENPKSQVILLEVGGPPPSMANVPAFWRSAINSTHDWQYKTQPQKGACLSNGGVCLWPRGKMLCGTACMSGHMYTRGHPSVYDEWSKNNPGWSYREVLNYFKKSEKNAEPKEEIDREYHGFDGPLRVGRYPYLPDLADNLLRAAKELNIPRTDPNGRRQETFTVAPVMTENGETAGPFKMYLRPAMRRKNLRVVTGAHVLRVVFDKSGTAAMGVEFRDKSNKLRTVKAKKEVILSGGVVGSAQLLQLSGVGPKGVLEKLKIKVVRDLAVGENLHYHVGFAITTSLKGKNLNTINNETLSEFENRRIGPFTSTGLTQLTAFYATKHAVNKVPDIQFYLDGYIPKCRTREQQEKEKSVITFRPVYLLSKCRGSVTIKSTNSNDYPLIDPNYLCDDVEVKALRESVEYVRKLTGTKAMKECKAEFDVNEYKLCAQWHNKDDEKYWDCVIRQYTNGENHHAGTCKMGPKTDPKAVVDHELRVHGISNLRVADASVFPSPINCNTIGPVIMVGEKAADMIKRSWKL